jgi:predicted MFS family arabinose efflux permease
MAYGVCWFLGSAVLGILYDTSLIALVAFSVGIQLLSVPFFMLAARPGRQRSS